MADSTGAAPSGTTMEALYNQSSQFRRARPPDLNLNGGEETRVPLRPNTEKLNRRESKLGLRNIFGRSKDKSTADPDAAAMISPRDLSQKPGGIRASLAELSSNWPYSSHGARSELSLLSAPANQNLKHKKSASTVRGQPLPPKAPRGTLATWDPPPLFQAYPQAIKHAHLPACTLSAEAIIRLQSSRGSVSLRDGLNQSFLNLDAIDDTTVDKDKSKKRHKRNLSGSALEWTTKIFVLVTSGYLLQYAGDGSFDRLPERMLQLGKDSAAFASDVIPGRHWVLHVSSVTDPEGASASHSSLLSRLPFIGTDKKQAANFLMVFETADDIDSWIATLRREIEALGGKKSLTETGKPKTEDHNLQLKNQTSQRTLVVRDPDRFSRLFSPEIHWDQGGPVHSPEIHLDASDDMRDQSFDETSSASGYSQDGRQLDGLRDSANRLSFISSGQRTVVTSAGSSPACSPVRDSFASAGEDLTLTEIPRDQSRPRPRPNAAVIHDRRQSMQTMNQVELRVASATMPRPHSTYSNSWQPEPTVQSPPVHTTPNFSVPHGAGRRYSLAKSPSMDSAALAAATSQTRAPPTKSVRRPPPSALAINPRPLSFVEDHPSPLSPPPSQQGQQVTMHIASSTAPDTPSMFTSWAVENDRITKNQDEGIAGLPMRNSSLEPQETLPQLTGQSKFRRRSSSGTFSDRRRPADASDAHSFLLPTDIPVPPVPSSLPNVSAMRDPIPRSKSSLDHYRRGQSPAGPAASRRSVHGSRLSVYSQQSDRLPVPPPQPSLVADNGLGLPKFDPRDLPSRSRTPSIRPSARMSTSSQHLKIETVNKAILQRRSMSQLSSEAIPPPAPPPTCALPPIPVRMPDGHLEGIPF